MARRPDPMTMSPLALRRELARLARVLRRPARPVVYFNRELRRYERVLAALRAKQDPTGAARSARWKGQHAP